MSPFAEAGGGRFERGDYRDDYSDYGDYGDVIRIA